MSSLRSVVLLEDDPMDAVLIRRAINVPYPAAVVDHVDSRDAFLARLASEAVDVVISDSTVAGCEGLRAFHLARERHPHVPFLFLSGRSEPLDHDLVGLRSIGVSAFLSKSNMDALAPAIEIALVERERARQSLGLLLGLEQVLAAFSDLSTARDLDAVIAIVPRAARELTGADGATFVLRDGDVSYYAGEDGVEPLWKGRRIPMASCLSGWSMIHRQPAVVPNVHADPRFASSVYEPTFVRSAVIAPIRAMDPVGAIGTYWAEAREPHPQEVRLLQVFADATAVALQNVRAYEALDGRVREQSADFAALVSAISHDFSTPVHDAQAITGALLDERGESLDLETRQRIEHLLVAASRMGAMIDGVTLIGRTAESPVRRKTVDAAEIATAVAAECRATAARPVTFTCPPSLLVDADPVLLRRVLEQLLGNAWKFTSKQPEPRVEFGVTEGRPRVFYVRDNGAGFDDARAASLFKIFQRLHDSRDFPGTGVGLAIVQCIVRKHSGRVWAVGRPGDGATFYFTLGE